MAGSAGAALKAAFHPGLLPAFEADRTVMGLTCKSVASLLAQKHDKSATKDSGEATLFDHANLRGPGYYH